VILSYISLEVYTNFGILPIAQIIGYDNPLYFSRIFQRTKGISPSEYRKNI
ncbi:AraC family transcriptional regulator, partial [Anaerobutyricum hallii]|uniref:AraC family transcriptional regulator n=1 Tax=Anaerobutyricum hallii TaxID=39488 RepID=UPI00266B94CF